MSLSSSVGLVCNGFSKAVTRRTAAGARFFGAFGGIMRICDHASAKCDHSVTKKCAVPLHGCRTLAIARRGGGNRRGIWSVWSHENSGTGGMALLSSVGSGSSAKPWRNFMMCYPNRPRTKGGRERDIDFFPRPFPQYSRARGAFDPARPGRFGCSSSSRAVTRPAPSTAPKITRSTPYKSATSHPSHPA